MTNAQTAVTSLQTQAIEAIKSGQAAAVEAVQAWSQAVQKATPSVPSFDLPAGVKETIGDPAAIVDSVYDFAAKLIDLNKQFVHQLLAASAPADAAAKKTAK